MPLRSGFPRIDRSFQTGALAKPARPEVGTASGALVRVRCTGVSLELEARGKGRLGDLELLGGRLSGGEPVLELVARPGQRAREPVLGMACHPGEDLGRGRE